MERLTYRDDNSRAHFTQYGVKIYCSTQAIADCICKLEESCQEHEPRLMALEAVKTLTEHTVVYFQPNGVNPVRPRVVSSVSEDTITFTDGGWWTFEEYGSRFYLWTSCPTDKQRNEVKWND